MRKLLTVLLAVSGLLLAGAPVAALADPAVPGPSAAVPPLPATGAFVFRDEMPKALIYMRLPDAPAVDGRIQVWQIVVFRTVGADNARYTALLSEFDCDGKRTRTLSGVAYDENDKIVVSQLRNDPWRDAKPDTNAWADLTLACTGKPLPEDPNAEPLAGLAALRADMKTRLGL